MARITQDERDRKKALYDSVVLRIFLEEGWEAVTHGRVAHECVTKKSTIQGYYPTKKDFSSALQGKIRNHIPKSFAELLSSNGPLTRERFVETWDLEIQNSRIFREIAQMFVESILEGGSDFTGAAVAMLRAHLKPHIGEKEANSAIYEVIGLTIYRKSFERE
ncbi:hypothetical protein HGP28_18345 [Vibrio sp. SM6]|uniref:TetR/AcrR family transcriptional regulator n=1 Tax=Vibrio agarilyticus TaxID=2726741 RepID=A0A7X8TUL1_9VIBR|nr:hypothetical protein [Vibrio agarilyticus]NLS14822.1 hypothetical protein [Vibrio agarilyticus]